jgi:phenylpropionate dioxygenase-like ring-hydroxylating dioxygenase large terminal subunit
MLAVWLRREHNRVETAGTRANTGRRVLPCLKGRDAVVDDSIDLSQLEGVIRPPDQADSLPPWCYTSQAFLDLEIAQVFRSAWTSLGRADRVAAPGDYAAIELAGVPIVLLRDRAGALRAYANSCRHRGTKLLQGTGHCRVIKCPFHGWTYGLDGRLTWTPAMQRAEGFEKDDYGLLPVRLAERDGFAFVNLDGTAPPLDDWLGEFSDRHAPWSFADMVTARRREFEVACNWKLFLEVFNEYYHLRFVHPNSIGGIYDGPDEPEAVEGQFITQFGTHEGTGGLLEDDRDKAFPAIEGLEGRNRGGTRYTLVFPNLTFAASVDAMWIYDVTPRAPNRTCVGMTCAFPRATAALPDFAARAEAYLRRLDVAIAEDIKVLELQQAGLDSPLARPGRFSHLEPNVAAFGRWIAERCAKTAGAG